MKHLRGMFLPHVPQYLMLAGVDIENHVGVPPAPTVSPPWASRAQMPLLGMQTASVAKRIHPSFHQSLCTPSAAPRGQREERKRKMRRRRRRRGGCLLANEKMEGEDKRGAAPEIQSVSQWDHQLSTRSLSSSGNICPLGAPRQPPRSWLASVAVKGGRGRWRGWWVFAQYRLSLQRRKKKSMCDDVIIEAMSQKLVEMKLEINDWRFLMDKTNFYDCHSITKLGCKFKDNHNRLFMM